MEQNTKFDGIDYMKSYASKISTMHELIKTLLQDHICDGDIVIDIGGGPGMGARIIDELGKKAVVINIEPSTTIDDVPQLSTVEYIPLRMSMKEALDAQMPYTPDCLLMVSSAHEIALCNNAQAHENKRVFFQDLNNFIKKNLKPNGTIIIGFPNYFKGATQSEIDRQRKLTESVFGHSHPSNEFFLLEEFSVALGMQPVVHIQRPMDISPSSSQKTVLMANGVIFSPNHSTIGLQVRSIPNLVLNVHIRDITSEMISWIMWGGRVCNHRHPQDEYWAKNYKHERIWVSNTSFYCVVDLDVMVFAVSTLSSIIVFKSLPFVFS